MKTIWQNVKTAVKGNIPDYSYRMWIETLSLGECQGSQITLICPNDFVLKRIQGNYAQLLSSEMAKEMGATCKLSFHVNKKKEPDITLLYTSDQTQLALPGMQVQLPPLLGCSKNLSGRLLRKDYTFDKFVVGEGNDFAYVAALSMAAQKNSNQDSLFLLSQTGMGKSHLSQAVGHHILTSSPAHRVLYHTADDFTNDMVNAFRNNCIHEFKNKYRDGCDVLILEDVQFLTGKDRTQIELALALDYLMDSGKKIIFTSCLPPDKIPKMNAQLKSRLSGGLLPHIDAPDFKTRVKILRKRAREYECNLPVDVIEYLASELSDNVRQLLSGLVGISAKSSLLGNPVDIKLAKSVVNNIAVRGKTVTIDLIKKIVAKHYQLSIEDLVSKSRKRSLVFSRNMAMYLSRRYTDHTLQAIGKNFNRYHATAIRAIKLINQATKNDHSTKKQVQYLCGKLDSGEWDQTSK